MFKNKIVFLLFVIYITNAFAVPTNIVEYNDREDSEGDVNHEHEQTVNENYFPEGFMNAELLYKYMTKHLKNICQYFTLDDCKTLVQNYAMSNPIKGLTQAEYIKVSSEISASMFPSLQ